MGTFLGHALPGSFFLLFAIWWHTQLTRRYIICKKQGKQFCSSASFPLLWRCMSNWPIEGILKLTVTTVGMIGEMIAATNYLHANAFVFMGDLQHVTMYAFFAISGAVDIFANRGYRFIPPGLDYVAGALAFTAEALLFTFHLHGRSPLDIVLHQLLVFAIAACVLATLFECKYRSEPIIPFLRVFFVFLQGTWFFQVGFILYPPHPVFRTLVYSIRSDSDVTAAGIIFAWHCAGVIIAMAIISVITRTVINHCCLKTPAFGAYGKANSPNLQLDLSSDEDEMETSITDRLVYKTLSPRRHNVSTH